MYTCTNIQAGKIIRRYEKYGRGASYFSFLGEKMEIKKQEDKPNILRLIERLKNKGYYIKSKSKKKSKIRKKLCLNP